MKLIEELYTTDGLTFGDAVRMVELFADELGYLRRDPQTPNLFFLIGQKEVFEVEHERLAELNKENPENKCLEEARFLMCNTAERYQSDFFQL